MGKTAILCVDDEAILIMSLIQELKVYFGDRFIYESALSAESAIETLRDLADEGVSVILIISDWLMPGMKGDEFLIQVHQNNPSIRCIMITGHADESIKARVCKEANVCAILSKPWEADELIDAVIHCTETDECKEIE